jgi:hypothetical protein
MRIDAGYTVGDKDVAREFGVDELSPVRLTEKVMRFVDQNLVGKSRLTPQGGEQW